MDIGFKFPELWDPDFKGLLRADSDIRAKENIKRVLAQEKLRATERTQRSKELEELKRQFFSLHEDENRQRAGIKLERVLNSMFDLHGLSPREPFRITGEQIDGSFELDHEIYLLEAKWEQNPCPESDLLVFRGKIEGKSKYTRGVFVSINGISKEAAVAITQGKQPIFFVMNGYDITMLLEENMELTSFLRQRQRLLAEEGRVVVSFSELISEW